MASCSQWAPLRSHGKMRTFSLLCGMSFLPSQSPSPRALGMSQPSRLSSSSLTDSVSYSDHNRFSLQIASRKSSSRPQLRCPCSLDSSAVLIFDTGVNFREDLVHGLAATHGPGRSSYRLVSRVVFVLLLHVLYQGSPRASVFCTLSLSFDSSFRTAAFLLYSAPA